MTPAQRVSVAAIVTGLLVLTVTPSAQVSGIVFHDLGQQPFELRGRTQLKGVVTDEGSIGVAEVVEGAVQASHHHQQEQVQLVVSGELDSSVAGEVYRMGVHGATLPPSNSAHFYTNRFAGPSRFIEYQPVRRTDWVPPFAAYTPIKTPEPVPGPFSQTIAAYLASSPGQAWQTLGPGARMRRLAGATIQARSIELSKGASTEITTDGDLASFLYVLSGPVEFVSGPMTREINRDMVVQVPTATTFTLRAAGDGPALVAVFSQRPR